ncbi:rCG52556 [Rattus norvegicus]|uniref:RCG52556 n=1 Tax=Rattus norvegicus TaxID=10116 RepID=A6IQU9_RAT|nr:rCG52556 [Rattus norvegicus]
MRTSVNSPEPCRLLRRPSSRPRSICT